MTLTEMITRFKILVPSAIDSGVGNAEITDFLNEAVNEINYVTKIFKGKTEWESDVGTQTYQFSSKIPNYSGMAKSGVWYETATANKFLEVIPKSEEWLDNYFSNWRDSANGVPQYYFADGDELTFNTPFNAVRTIRVFHTKLAVAMDSGDNYPWNNLTTEITAFRPMDVAIIDYVRWKIQPSLGKDAKGLLTQAQFSASALSGARKIRRRPDRTSYRSEGRTVR